MPFTDCLFSLFHLKQTRGDYSPSQDMCNPNDGFVSTDCLLWIALSNKLTIKMLHCNNHWFNSHSPSLLSQGTYCPTTCGVADYLQRYKPDIDRKLDEMEQDLEEIANLTRGAQDKVVYLKDSETQAQKQAPGSTIFH